MPVYFHKSKVGPKFSWDREKIVPLLIQVRHRQGYMLGRMDGIGNALQTEADLHALVVHVLMSYAIDGIMLDPDQVRSSIAQHLGIHPASGLSDFVSGLPDPSVEKAVSTILDATQRYDDPLTHERLLGWHDPQADPSRIASATKRRGNIHFQAPGSDAGAAELKKFLSWFNVEKQLDPVIKAAIAYLWFMMIVPFDEGNGHIARTFATMQLARADRSPRQFYSLSAQIMAEKSAYENILEKTRTDPSDITPWLEWFLGCLDRALANTDNTLGLVLRKARFWERHGAKPLSERQRTMLNTLLDDHEGKLTSSQWANMTGSSQDTAGRDINDLVNKGILIKEGGGGRSTGYALNCILGTG